MICVFDFIKIHQTNKNFSKWYFESIEKLSKYIDVDSSTILLHYLILQVIDESMFIVPDMEKYRSLYITEAYCTIIEQLNGDKDFGVLEDYIFRNDKYISFINDFMIREFAEEKFIGDYWLNLMDHKIRNMDSKISVMEDLIFVVTWCETFVKAYIYQYWTKNKNSVFYMGSKIRLNYWTLKQIEEYNDTFPSQSGQFDNKISMFEELLIELLEKGMDVEPALCIARRIKNGIRLTTTDMLYLPQDKEWLEELEKIDCLPSLSDKLWEILNVNKLIE